MTNVAVVGAGSWGTAIAWLLGSKGVDTIMWARSDEVADGINQTSRNPRYLDSVALPDTVRATTDITTAVETAHVVVMATPSHAVRTTMQAAVASMTADAVAVSLAKGLEQGTGKRMTQIIAEELGDESRAAALSGPNHAEEVSRGIPSTTVIAAYDEPTGMMLQELFTSPGLRVYTNADVVGVELAGASKNVIAIAAGMSDGLGYGDNTKASLMTRGLAEMTRLGDVMGANPLTYMGLAGMGDLIATCTSMHSRNRGLGEEIARGGSIDSFRERTHMVAEGAMAALVIDELAGEVGLELPITRQVRDILYEGASCEQAVGALMTRTSTDELHGMGLLKDGE